MIRAFLRCCNPLRTVLALGLIGALAGCQVGGNGGVAGPRVSGGDVRVALLVPYGSAAAGDDIIARSLENSARLAASDMGDVAVEITVYPTLGQSSQAAAVADQAIREGADVIVGPLRSDAAAAASVATRGRLNILSFSNNTEIAGGNLYVLGNTFATTAERLVRYGAAQGRTRIVVVHAQNLAGELARNAVMTAAPASGSSVVGTVPYEFSANGVVDVLPTIIETVRDNQADILVLTSDTTGALPLFAQLLPENGLDTEAVRVVGMTRWDTPPQTLELSGLEGGWFALPDPGAAASFEARYQAAYGEPPHVLGAIAYDAIRAVGTAAAAGQIGAEQLTGGPGIQGANGVFRLNADGTNTRSLAVATVTESQVSIVDPAPGSIGAPGF